MGQTRWDSKLFWPNQRDDFKRNKIKVGLDKILTRDFFREPKVLKFQIFKDSIVHIKYIKRNMHMFMFKTSKEICT